MKNENILIFGAGFSGKAYGVLAGRLGAAVTGTTRSADRADNLHALGISSVIFDGMMTDAIRAAVKNATQIIISIAPGDDGDPVLRALETDGVFNAPHLQWLAYLSTVGVYGNHDGAWVDENTVCKPVSERSVQRVAAEQAWTDFAQSHDLPLAVLRLSGIYGSGRNGIVNMTKGNARRLVKKGQVFNRIHVADIARALAHLSNLRANGVFNVTDDEPAPPQDVIEYVASLMKVDAPPEIDFETATLSPMARSFYGENKRVSNARIKETGFDFHYKDYRTAFKRMWDEKTWA